MSNASSTWHAGPELLRQYAAGRLDPVGQAAVETHVERCVECRGEATALVTPPTLAPVWERVLETVRTPRPAWPFRALRRLGVPEVDLVVLRASANLVLGLSIAVVATLGFALTAGQLGPARQELLYLALAPLLPALLVAGAYDSTDPLRELAEPTPYGKLRVALLRTVVAVVGALPLLLLMGLVPNVDVSVVTCLLPALALALVLLVLMSFVPAVVGVGVVGSAWLLAVASLRARDELEAVTAPLGQSLALAVALAAAAALVARLGAGRPEMGRP